jgi:hypothetical protein
MPIDPPFDPNNAWWPNPGWPRSGPLGGPYPDDWTDPFINPRPIAPAAIAPFSAAQLGAMAWHPPIFPGDWASLPASNFPGAAWPVPVPPAASISNNDLTAAPAWPDPQSPYLSPGTSAAPGAPRWSDNLGELLSRDPSFPLGLFPHPFGSDPGPTSRFGSGPFSAAGPAASAPMPSLPGASSAPGWAASLRAPLGQFSSPAAPSDDRTSPFVSSSPIDSGLFSHDPSIPLGLFPYPFDSDPGPSSRFGAGLFSADGPAASTPMPSMPEAASAPGWAPSLLAPPGQLQGPFAVGAPALGGASSLPPNSANSAATPTRSVLFNRPQPDWDFASALTARERDAAALDAVAQGLGADGLPLSKSGAPYVAPYGAPALPLSFEPPQWLDVARFLSPNIVDYFTKTPPPAPPFPPTPGKIPSEDSNPYAPGALVDTLNLAILAAAIVSGGEAAPLALARFAGKVGSSASAEELAALSARARQIHAALDEIAQRNRTTAVLSTDGDTIIAGGKRDLDPDQRALLRPGERAGKLPRTHAEITALNEALKAGLTPRATATTRRICEGCQAAIEDKKGILTSETTAIFPPLR